jgi:Peptidase family S41
MYFSLRQTHHQRSLRWRCFLLIRGKMAMKSNWFAALLCVCLLYGAFFPAAAQQATTEKIAPTKPASPDAWRELTLRDLASIDKNIRDHTPIPLDTENAASLAWLEKGMVEAQARAANVTNEVGWYYTLAAFVNGFRDPHVAIRPVGTLPSPRWPGFIAAAYGANAVVVMRDVDDQDAPAIGTEILQCDGKALGALTEERVFPFVMNARIPADRRRAIPRLFLDRQIPFAPAPASCRIKTKTGERDLVLRWRLAPTEADAKQFAAWNQAFNSAGIGPTPDFGITEPAPGITWISVPTFNSGGESGTKLDALVKDVEKRGDAMRSGGAIVIDTRGNGGGNSAWADRLANAIFTPDVIRKHRANSWPSGTDWRASEGNIAAWKDFDSVLAKDFGTLSKERLFPQLVATSMQTALDNNESIWRQGDRKTGKSGGLTQKRIGLADKPSPFNARVYFLSNGSCGSSCLNFADTVLFIPGVKLIGAATSADGMLMDVRNVETASGLARLTIPQKVARGRARGNLEFYAQDIAYDGLWDDAAVRAWVMALIEKESIKK